MPPTETTEIALVPATVYANIVVNVEAPGIRQPLTYVVPPLLRESAVPGACVVVPFGKREAIGYIVSLAPNPPADVPLTAISRYSRTCHRRWRDAP